MLIINITFLSVNAKEHEISASEMHRQLCNMILKNEGASVSSPDIIFPANRLLVKTNSNEKLDKNYGAIDSVEGYKNIHIFQYDSMSKTDYAYQNFLDDDIEYVEYDFYFNTNSELTTSSRSSTENIEHLSWNSEVAQIDKAFKYLNEEAVTCEEVTVAIIDSGIYAEHDFFSQSRLIDSGYARVDENGKSYPSLADDANHGTHVAGIIYDNTMSNVYLCPYRTFPLIEVESYSVIWLAFELAVENGADVINMSLGGKANNESDKNGKKYCISLNESISEASKKGIIVVVAAGNEMGDADTNYPDCCPDAITVAATNIQNHPDTNYSASGKCVDIAAPGTNINSTVPRMWSYLQAYGHNDRTYDHIPKSLYREMSGTSLATPLVAAAAATLKSIDPDITPAEVKRIIKETAYVPGDWEESCQGNNYGTGIVNFYNAVKAVLEPEYSVTPTINVNSDNKFEITVPEGKNARIYYTLDGTVPTPDNHLTYTEPLNLRSMHTDKIIAVRHENGMLMSTPVIYNMITYDDKTVFCKWSDNLTVNGNAKNASWYSKNPDIVTVDENGRITGVSRGSAKVVCRLKSGEEIIWKVNVRYSPLQAFIYLFFFGFVWM